jgi:putative PIN family toxin of toxin-antitoxin system
VVLDTSVLVAGLRSRRGASYRLLELVASGEVIPVLSVPLVLEYEEALKRQPRLVGLSAEEVDALLDDLCELGECRAVYYLWRPTLRDPRDELVLEVAVAAGCADIVTHNVRDFVGSEQLGVAISTPRQWLIKIGVRS